MLNTNDDGAYFLSEWAWSPDPPTPRPETDCCLSPDLSETFNVSVRMFERRSASVTTSFRAHVSIRVNRLRTRHKSPKGGQIQGLTPFRVERMSVTGNKGWIRPLKPQTVSNKPCE